MIAAVHISSDVSQSVGRHKIQAVGDALGELLRRGSTLSSEQSCRVRKAYARILSVVLVGLDIETVVEPIPGGVVVTLHGYAEACFAVGFEELDRHARACVSDRLRRPELHPDFTEA